MKSHLFRYLLVFIALNGFNSCKKDDIDTALLDKVSSIDVFRTGINDLVDGIDRKLLLTAVAKNQNGQALSGKTFSWSSNNDQIAEVNQEGMVSILGAGPITITASAESVSGNIVLDIKERPSGGMIAFTNVNILTMENESILDDQTVLVEDGFISKIGPSESVQIPSIFEIIEGKGQFLLPGLADMHVHPFLPSDLIPYLASGVTTVLDMGNGFYFTESKNWKRQVFNGQIPGPNIYISANARGSSDRGPAVIITESPERGREFVRIHADFDFIKVYNGIPANTFEAILDESEKLGITVIGHAVRQTGLRTSLQNGQKMIAHAEEYVFSYFRTNLNPDESEIEDAIFQTKNANAYVTGNLSIDEAFMIISESGFNQLMQRPGVEYLNNLYLDGSANNELRLLSWSEIATQFRQNNPGTWRPVLEFEMNLMKRFHDAGIPILLGTDSPPQPGLVPGFSIHEDMRLYQEAGISNYDVIRIGTANAGEFINTYLKNSDPFGFVKEGYRADLILVQGNPVDDLNLLRRPEVVVVRGNVYTKEELQSLLDQL